MGQRIIFDFIEKVFTQSARTAGLVPLGVTATRIPQGTMASRLGTIRGGGRSVPVVEGHLVYSAEVAGSRLMAGFAPTGTVAHAAVMVRSRCGPARRTGMTGFAIHRGSI